MVAAAAKNLGKIPCPCCAEPVALKQTASGILKYECQDADCEASGFARPHTARARAWLELVGQKAAAPSPAAPSPAPTPAPAPPPAPVKKPAKPFDMLGL